MLLTFREKNALDRLMNHWNDEDEDTEGEFYIDYSWSNNEQASEIVQDLLTINLACSRCENNSGLRIDISPHYYINAKPSGELLSLIKERYSPEHRRAYAESGIRAEILNHLSGQEFINKNTFVQTVDIASRLDKTREQIIFHIRKMMDEGYVSMHLKEEGFVTFKVQLPFKLKTGDIK